MRVRVRLGGRCSVALRFRELRSERREKDRSRGKKPERSQDSGTRHAAARSKECKVSSRAGERQAASRSERREPTNLALEKILKEKSCGRATVHLTRNESQTRSKSELVVSAVVIHLRADHPLPLPSRTPRPLAALVGPAATAPARSAAQAPPSGPIPPPSAHARHSLLQPSLKHPPRPWSPARPPGPDPPARRARGLPSSTKCGTCFLVPFFCRQFLRLFWPPSILSTKISLFGPDSGSVLAVDKKRAEVAILSTKRLF